MIANGLENLKRKWEDVETRKYPLYAIFLYTSADTKIKNLVEKHWKDIHALSGTWCLIFAFHRENAGFGHVLSVDMPLEEAYIIAKEFGIHFQSLPGLVFFEDICSNEAVFVSCKHLVSEEDFINEMRTIFSAIQAQSGLDVVRKHAERRKLKLLMMDLKKPLREIFRAIIGCL